MTSNDIIQLDIIATTKDGEYLFTNTATRAIIDLVASLCEFYKVKKEYVEQHSVKDFVLKNSFMD